MSLRDRLLAMTGIRLLGDEFQWVAQMLPEARRIAVLSALEALKGTDREQVSADLSRFRKRHARRVNRLARKRYGAAWDQLAPRVAQTVLLHGRDQDH